ncbi:hypothetical protein RHGRI_038502 [Rhododendron griersonianum]|uniref:DUF4283 domain-containing protein n=1 Tax=Rhododendron griersonianum TaxID=479676 RepID=A0AAV6HIY1_9ERIC|nr:hypothetical protein RHGRI_038502 [Rhododendron griersonianum]
MKPAQEQPVKVPAWVKFHDLPLELWNQECLSRVASTIGRPIHVDQATAKTAKQPGLLNTKSTTARICIEVSAEQDLPDEVTVLVEGESVVVPIEYQVLPPICKICHVFGHPTERCAKSAIHSSSHLLYEVKVDSPSGNGKQKADLEQPIAGSILLQGGSSKSSPPILQEQQAINSVASGSESESEEKLLEVLGGVVSNSHEVPQQQLKMGVMSDKTDSCHSAGPTEEQVSELNQTPTPKPPDPRGAEVRDEAPKEDLKGSFQKVLSRSAQRRLQKLAREQSRSSLVRGRH